MKFKIVGDSCSEFTKEDLQKEYMEMVPLTILIGDKEYIDDEELDVNMLLEEMTKSDSGAKTACPAPQIYADAYEGAEDVYVVTLSQKLSGSYASADIARDIFEEEHEGVNIHVFDSKTAASGQYAIIKKIEELALLDTPFEEVVKQVNEFIDNLKTVFVLENLDNMMKNGRISKVKMTLANALHIKPVLHGVNGEIEQLDQARGMNKALNRMLHHIEKDERKVSEKKAVISFCDCHNRALNVKKVLIENLGFSEVIMVETRGIGTVYENRGGIVVVY